MAERFIFVFLSRPSLSRNRPGVLGSGPVSRRLLPSTTEKSEISLAALPWPDSLAVLFLRRR
jgi:hypothetical protein